MAIPSTNYSLAQFQANIAQHPELKDQLHSFITIDLEKVASDAAFYENLWSIAAIVGVVAATILAAGAVVTVAVLNPEIIFVAIAVAASVIAPLIPWILETTNERSQFYGQNAKIANRQIEIANELLQLNDKEFEERLTGLSEVWVQGEDSDDSEEKQEIETITIDLDFSVCDKMKQIDGTQEGYRAYTMALAAYEYWIEYAEQIETKNKAIKREAKALRNQIRDPNSTLSDSEEKRLKSMMYEKLHEFLANQEHHICKANILAAFYHYILENPLNDDNDDGTFTEKKLSDFGEIKTMSPTERILLSIFSNQPNPIFIAAETKEEFDFEDILYDPVYETSQKIFNS